MKLKKILLVVGLVLFSIPGLFAQQTCSEFEKITKKDNATIFTSITSLAIQFKDEAEKFNRDGALKYLDLLKCALQGYVQNDPAGISDKSTLATIIDDLKDNINNFLNPGGKSLGRLQTTLNVYEKETNEIYVKRMENINKITQRNLFTKQISPIKPESIWPGYDKFLNSFKERPRTPTGVINFLLTKNLLSSKPAEEPRTAQILFDKLTRLKRALTDKYNKSLIKIGSKIPSQIASLDAIMAALKETFGEFVTYYTTLPHFYDDELLSTKDKTSVLFASVALALNTIVRYLNDKVRAGK